MLVTYDDLDWIIDPIPIGSCTPDHLYEVNFRASAVCPNCGAEIDGVANFWSRSEDMDDAWVESIDYEPCDCEDEDYDEDDEDEE
jgi:hypothetical protein